MREKAETRAKRIPCFKMKVRVRFEKILEERGDSVAFLVFGRKVVLNKADFKRGKKNTIILERDMAGAFSLRWKLLFHFPPVIKPEYNQVCIDELRC
jgi:hypothetical protein